MKYTSSKFSKAAIPIVKSNLFVSLIPSPPRKFPNDQSDIRPETSESSASLHNLREDSRLEDLELSRPDHFQDPLVEVFESPAWKVSRDLLGRTLVVYSPLFETSFDLKTAPP